MPLDKTGKWYPVLSPRQQELRQICTQKTYVLAEGPRFSGKCVSPDTLVFTENGVECIGGLGHAPVGQYGPASGTVMSMNPDGSSVGPARIAQFYNSGAIPSITLESASGYRVTCSENHPLWSEHAGQIRYRTSCEIRDIIRSGGRVWLPLVMQNSVWRGVSQTIEFDHQPKQSKTPIHLTLTLDPDLAYAIGLFIGDGCCTPPILAAHRCNFSSNDAAIVSDLIRILSARLPGFALKHDRGCDYQIRGSAFRAMIKCLGISGKYAHEKSVPQVIMKSPKEVVVAFLQGLFDTDGTCDKNHKASYCSSSRVLAGQVQVLMLACGVRSSIKFKRNNKRGAWNVYARGEDDFAGVIGFRLKRKQERLAKNPQFDRTLTCYPPSILKVLSQLHRCRSDRGIGELSREIHKHVIGGLLRRNVAISPRRINDFCQAAGCVGHALLSQYLAGGDIWWDECCSVAPGSSPLVDICVPGNQSFIGNGFINHNTVACLHAVAEHAWNTPKANIVIITISQTVGYDSGVWPLLTDQIIPQWINGDEVRCGMEWAKQPFIMGVSKKPTLKVTNYWGGESVIQLESLQNEGEVEARFKPRQYSMIYIPELSTFRKRKTFDTLSECLRGMLHLKESQYLFLADTNPADEGTSSWIYKLWFDLFGSEDDKFDDVTYRKEELALKRNMARVSFTIADNTFADPQRVALLKSRYAHDADLYERYINGRWVTATEDALFFKVFRPAVHVVGEEETAQNPNPQTLVPEEGCYELQTGLDPGGTNFASVIGEKFTRKVEGRDVTCFKVLDELVVVGQDFDLNDYVEALVQKMDLWEGVIGKTGKMVQWRHWSDSNVFDLRVPFSDRYWHQHIFEASGGRIALMAAQKGRGSVAQRVDLFRKMLWEERVFLSRSRCPHCIEMIKSIRRGKTAVAAIELGSIWKHAFDALTYWIASEAWDEINQAVIARLARRPGGESRLVQVGL